MTIPFPFAISGFHAEPMELNESFMETASRFAAITGTGLMGYLVYDLKDLPEKLPRTSVDDLGLTLCLYAPSVLVQDAVSRKSRICAPITTSVKESTISDNLE